MVKSEESGVAQSFSLLYLDEDLRFNLKKIWLSDYDLYFRSMQSSLF